MNQSNVSESVEGISTKVRNWRANHPNMAMAMDVTLQIGLIGVTALVGYRAGKKNGVKQGEVRGYAGALNDIGVSPAEVPVLASAWQETREQYVEAMNKAEALPA